MSEVLGTVILTGMTVVVLGGFGVVLLSAMDDAREPPSGAFVLEAREGETSVLLRMLDGRPFALDGASVLIFVDGAHATGEATLRAPASPGVLAPGGVLSIDLITGPLAALARVDALVVDAETGKTIGRTVTTVPGAGGAASFASGVPSIASASFTPSVLTVDGRSLANLTVAVGSSMGLGLVDAVSANLSLLGGPSEVLLRDDGQGADALAGDGLYVAQVVAAHRAFAAVPSTESVAVPVAVRDVFGKVATTTAPLLVQPPPQVKVGTGAKYRDLPTSDDVRYLNLSGFSFRDAAVLDNDQVDVRVKDLGGTGAAWNALVTFADPDTCGGLPGVSAIRLSRDGVSGSVTYVPSGVPCLTLGALSRVHLVDPSTSLDAGGNAISWTTSGPAASYLYAAAGIGPVNEATVTFFGDSLSVAPGSVGLGDGDLTWARKAANAPPTASFTRSSSFLTVNVDATASSDPEGGVLTYAWDWGNGQTTSASASPTASHAYASAGAYVVTLTVRDPAGATGVTSAAVSVAAPNAAPVITSFARTGGVDLNATLAVGASDPDGNPLGYVFAWGDATPPTGTGSVATASHAYGRAGNYTVTVYANDTFGASASAALVVQVVENRYALLTTTDFAAPAGSVANVQNVQAADGVGATFTESGGTGGTTAQPTHCDRAFDGCAATNWTLVSGTFSTPSIGGAGSGSTLAGGTSGNSLVLSTSGAGPNGLRTGSYRVQWTQPADPAAGVSTFTMGYRFSATTAGQSITMTLVAPNGAATNLGTANGANLNWNLFTGASIPASVAQQGGTFTLFANATVDKNANVAIDDASVGWTSSSPSRLQKQMVIPSLPADAGLTYHLEIHGRQTTSPETLLVQVEGPAGTWTTRGSIASTSPGTVVYALTASDIISGAVHVRLVDATSTGDLAASAWDVDYVRVVVRG